MPRQPRMRRVDEAVRAVLSDAIGRDLQDPRVGFVTVTGVETSPDLRHARVFVSVLGDSDARANSLTGLRSAHGFLQGRVASELSLKHTPMLTFEYDESVDRGMRISRLIDETESLAEAGQREREHRPREGPTPEGGRHNQSAGRDAPRRNLYG